MNNSYNNCTFLKYLNSVVQISFFFNGDTLINLKFFINKISSRFVGCWKIFLSSAKYGHSRRRCFMEINMMYCRIRTWVLPAILVLLSLSVRGWCLCGRPDDPNNNIILVVKIQIIWNHVLNRNTRTYIVYQVYDV